MSAAPLLSPDVEHSNDNILSAMKALKTWPVLATKKLDGIRAVRTTDLFSRRLKLIPNIEVRRRSMVMPYGLDMELFNPDLPYDQIESIVMSESHPDHEKIQFHMLDYFDVDEYRAESGYMDRMRRLGIWSSSHRCSGFVFQKPEVMETPEQLMEFFLRCESENGEGICFRTFTGKYKQGRSTLNEQYLVKLCRYVRTEVTVVGFEEQMLNKNRTKSNAVGMMDRSSMKARQMGKDTLGAFLCVTEDGKDVRVGTGVGLTDEHRQEIWDSREKYINKQITIKHKPHGQKLKPRSPILIGFREEGY